MGKLEAQDSAIAALTRAVEGIVDKLATPFAQLDGRLDGVAGRFEGVAGRMDGLEDKLATIHRRIDELAAHIDKHLDKQDGKLDALPGNVHGPVRERIGQAESNLRGRIDEVDGGLRGHVDSAKDTIGTSVSDAAAAVQSKLTDAANALHNNIDEKATGVRGAVDEARKSVQDAVDDTKTTVDGTERLESLAARLEQVTGRLDALTSRLDTVEDGFTEKIANLGSTLSDSLTKVEGTLGRQPDNDQLASMVRKSNEESEQPHRRPPRRGHGHLRGADDGRWPAAPPAGHPAPADGPPPQRQGPAEAATEESEESLEQLARLTAPPRTRWGRSAVPGHRAARPGMTCGRASHSPQAAHNRRQLAREGARRVDNHRATRGPPVFQPIRGV